jgi:hypothetical protein
MAQIDVSLEGLGRLVNRLTKEYGELCGANFALDEQLNMAVLQVQHLAEQRNDKEVALKALRAHNEEMGIEIDKLRKALDPDPAHTHRYGRANRQRKHIKTD